MGEKINSAKEWFDTIGNRFQKDAAKGVKAIFQFELSGANGGTYAVAVDDANVVVSEGAHTTPSVTLKMSADDYVKMANGDLKGQMAFMTGKMKVSGNMMLAMKMQSLFPPAK